MCAVWVNEKNGRGDEAVKTLRIFKSEQEGHHQDWVVYYHFNAMNFANGHQAATEK